MEGHRTAKCCRIVERPPDRAKRLGVRQPFRLRGAPKRRSGATAAGASSGLALTDFDRLCAARTPVIS